MKSRRLALRRPKARQQLLRNPTLSQLRRQTRLARIAKTLAAGATITGIGGTLASKEANSPEYRHFIVDFVNAEIVDFVNAEIEEMQRMFYLALRTIERPVWQMPSVTRTCGVVKPPLIIEVPSRRVASPWQ